MKKLQMIRIQTIRFKIIFVLIATLVGCTSSLTLEKLTSLRIVDDLELVKGELNNGLDYYIYPKSHEKINTIELRMIVHAGSLHELDNQKGYAHFVEHMAFKGTKNFSLEKMAEIEKKIGLTLGPDLNAFTQHRHTYYSLSVKKFDSQSITQSMRLLRDWITNIRFDKQAVDAERGVIEQEYFLKGQTDNKVDLKIIKALSKNSSYENSIPIGTLKSIREADSAGLKKFYDAWYQPDNISLIVVGDIKSNQMIDLIKKNFSDLTGKASKQPTIKSTNLDALKDKVLIISGEDRQREFVNRIFFDNHRQPETYEELKSAIVSLLWKNIYLNRLNEEQSRANQVPSFGLDYPNYIPEISFSRLYHHLQNDDFMMPLKLFLSVDRQLIENGVSLEELQNAKLSFAGYVRKSFYGQLGETPTVTADRLLFNVLSNTVFTSPSYWNNSDIMANSIDLDTVNKAMKNELKRNHSLLSFEAPLYRASSQPNEQRIRQFISKLKRQDISDGSINIPNTNHEVKSGKYRLHNYKAISGDPGTILTETLIESIDVIKWKLQNNRRVYYRYSNDNPSQFLITAFSRGGLFDRSNSEVEKSKVFSDFVNSYKLQSIYGKKFYEDYGKFARLAVVYMYPEYKGYMLEGDGKYAEYSFKILNLLHKKQVSVSQQWFDSMKQSRLSELSKYNNSPAAKYYKKINQNLYKNLVPFRPILSEGMQKFNRGHLVEFFNNEYINQDFDYVIVGDLSVNKARDLVKKYLAGLTINPSKGLNNTKNSNLSIPPIKKSQKFVIKGDSTARSDINLFFRYQPKKITKNTQQAEFIVIELLRNELFNQLRDSGLVYGVSVNRDKLRLFNPSHVWVISLSTSKLKKNKAIKKIEEIIASLPEKIKDKQYLNNAIGRVVPSSIKNNTVLTIWTNKLISDLLVNNIQPERLTNPKNWYGRVTREDVENVLHGNFKTYIRADYDPK